MKKLKKYFRVQSRYPVDDVGVEMFRKLVIPMVIFSILIAGCISGPNTAKGTLNFSSSPSGAQIYLDSQYQGTTPSTLPGINPGDHTLEYRYPGYQSWYTNITVSSGSSVIYAALIPAGMIANPSSLVQVVTAPAPSSPQALTLNVGKDPMIVGNSQIFSGTGTPGGTVQLVLSGPGKYTNGVNLSQLTVGSGGTWQYTWNPGSSVLAGSYSIVASDPQKATSVRAAFNVVGGGQVTVITGRYSYKIGDTITFSGLCTTGAQSVILTLSGPGQFSNGISLGTQSVNADNSWTYKYVTSYSMPVGSYTINVNDAQMTASASSIFSVSSG